MSDPWESYLKEMQKKWLKRYDALKLFIAEHGNISIPKEIRVEGIPLRTWKSRQKSEFAIGQLSRERIILLEKIPEWTWDKRNTYSWESSFYRLRSLFRKGKYPKDGSYLSIWYQHQKSYFKQGKLKESRVSAFKDAGISLEAKKPPSWNQLYNELKACNELPNQTTALGSWVYKQKAKYKANKLSSKKIKLLELLPFWSWSIKSNGKPWEESYKEFKHFVKKHNRFPRRRESLGSWFFKQRSRISKGKISKMQHKKLKEINGWIW